MPFQQDLGFYNNEISVHFIYDKSVYCILVLKTVICLCLQTFYC